MDPGEWPEGGERISCHCFRGRDCHQAANARSCARQDVVAVPMEAELQGGRAGGGSCAAFGAEG